MRGNTYLKMQPKYSCPHPHPHPSPGSFLCSGHLVGPLFCSDERLQDAAVGPGWAQGSRFKMEPCSRLESRDFPSPEGSRAPGQAAWPAPRAARRPLQPASCLRAARTGGRRLSRARRRAARGPRLRRTRPGAGAQQVPPAAVAAPAPLVNARRQLPSPGSAPQTYGHLPGGLESPAVAGPRGPQKRGRVSGSGDGVLIWTLGLSKRKEQQQPQKNHCCKFLPIGSPARRWAKLRKPGSGWVE